MKRIKRTKRTKKRVPDKVRRLLAQKKKELEIISKKVGGKDAERLKKAFDKLYKDVVQKKEWQVLDKRRSHNAKNLFMDYRLKAKKPGRRISKSGKRYYEYRENRSDIGRI